MNLLVLRNNNGETTEVVCCDRCKEALLWGAPLRDGEHAYPADADLDCEFRGPCSQPEIA